MSIRQPIVVVLGHVDHGKTTLLDKIRGTAVAAREPGAISQHIGASFVPANVLSKVCSSLLERFRFKIEVPGLLFIDTPGHSAFSNLRRRGGSVADIAILVVDLMEGVKPQTVESIDILKTRRTPFLVAANKLDLVSGWRPHPDKSFIEVVNLVDQSVVRTLDEKLYSIIGSLSTHNLNTERFDRITDFTRTIAIIPLSAKTGEGIPDLLTILVGLTQQYMRSQLTVTSAAAKGTVLEVREDVGLGVNINTIIYDGMLRENDEIVIGGKTKPISTRVRAILIPKPLDEIRDPREKFKKIREVSAAAGVKIVAPGFEEAVAGSPLYAVSSATPLNELLEKVREEVESVKISTDKLGVVIKADTLGSLEALENELQKYDVPIRIADVGDVSKRDITEASVVKAEAPTLGVVLDFNVKVLPDALEESLKNDVKIFQENVIYSLIEEYQGWVKQEKEAKTQKTLESLVRPGKVRLLPGFVFRRSKPAVVGVEVLAGRIRPHYGLVKTDGNDVGKIVQVQERGQNLAEATKGMQVAISMKEPTVGRQVRENDVLYVDVPEDHVKVLLKEFQPMLSQEDVECLRELIELKRKKEPYFGYGI